MVVDALNCTAASSRGHHNPDELTVSRHRRASETLTVAEDKRTCRNRHRVQQFVVDVDVVTNHDTQRHVHLGQREAPAVLHPQMQTLRGITLVVSENHQRSYLADFGAEIGDERSVNGNRDGYAIAPVRHPVVEPGVHSYSFVDRATIKLAQ
ncbi:hypothetical protein D3C86_1167140 [compost metagenome]